MFQRSSLLFLMIFMLSPGTSSAQVAGNAQIQDLAEQLLMGADVKVKGASLATTHLIPEFYSRREFTPAWTDAKKIDEFVQLVSNVTQDGLNPSDYLFAELTDLVTERRQNPEDADIQGQLDVLLTESVGRLGNHLLFGKVDPADLDENWNWVQSTDGIDPATTVQHAIDAASIEEFVGAFLDRGPIYRRMQAMLAEYREIGRTGGWPQVSEGPTLKPGMQAPRINWIRKRLAVTSDLPASSNLTSDQFDDELETAVIRFQDRHNLEADGVIGAQTIAAMNVTVEQRIDQLRVNLERLRWIIRDIEDEFVVTNIASFQTFLVRDRKIVYEGRSQVGRHYRQTPVFTDKIKYMQFNPTWTVPPGILTNDILPAVQKDIGYLAKKEMDLIDRDGNKVDPASVDWASYGPGRLPPYQFVQRPGPSNALGRVKFIFPNPHFVFLHDTPSKGLFERAERTFSSGCIRVENPYVFAELLMNNPDKLNQDSIQSLLDSKKPQTVFLEEPMTVMLLYSTVGALDMETVRFYNDIYQRDAAVLESLNTPYSFRSPAQN
ncbi:MAG: L,D-transpeptidase family protein [Woeseiaceae bacterium]